jgi:hypothetical protein
MRKSNLQVSLHRQSTKQLLKTYSMIMDELLARKVIRTYNNPTGDYAETLFQKALRWTLQPNSNAGYDATSDDGKRYEIKGRRITKRNGSRQLGAIRNLEKNKFDYLAGILFNDDYSVNKAVLIPRKKLKEMKNIYSSHVNARIFQLDDAVWKIKGARNVTKKLRAAHR